MNDKQTAAEQLVNAFGLKDVSLTLIRLSWRKLQTLLLHVYEKKIEALSVTDVLRNYAENRFTVPASAPQRDLAAIDGVIYSQLPPEFESIELSPGTVIGANSVLAPLNSKTILSTIRNVEVVSDSAMVLTLECARRRAGGARKPPVHLATSHRLLRLQKYQAGSNLTPHFRAFALASAGDDSDGQNFEWDAISLQIRAWLDVLYGLSKSGFHLSDLTVALSDISLMEKLVSEKFIPREDVMTRLNTATRAVFKTNNIDLPDTLDTMRGFSSAAYPIRKSLERLKALEESIVEPLRGQYPGVRFVFHLARCAGIGYYSNLCYKIRAVSAAGRNFPVTDGGASNWTRRLLRNNGERLVTCGFGTDVFLRTFGSQGGSDMKTV